MMKSRLHVAPLKLFYRRKFRSAIRVRRMLSLRKMERDERANTNAAVRACNSVWQGISAIYPGIDNTRQRVAGCAIQRTVHAQTRTHIYTGASDLHRKKERRRLHIQHYTCAENSRPERNKDKCYDDDGSLNSLCCWPN